MIRVVKLWDEQGVPCGFCCNGHSGYAESGSDIICSAVSALVINTMNSIEAFTDDVCSCKQEQKSGTIEFRIVSKPCKESLLLLDSLFLGLQGIEDEYGKRYLTIFKEV